MKVTGSKAAPVKVVPEHWKPYRPFALTAQEGANPVETPLSATAGGPLTAQVTTHKSKLIKRSIETSLNVERFSNQKLKSLRRLLRCGRNYVEVVRDVQRETCCRLLGVNVQRVRAH